MTFSPDDFDTSGLELVPIEGEEPKNPLDGYTAEEQAEDAKLFSVAEQPVTEVVAGAEPAVDNPYNLATEAVVIDSDGLEVEQDSLSDDQKQALATLIPNYSERKREKVSDLEMYNLGVNTLMDQVSSFQGTKEEAKVVAQSFVKMKKAFPGFSLGDDVKLEYNDSVNNGSFSLR